MNYDSYSDLNVLGDISLDELTDILSTTIKYDDTNKVVLLLAMLTTYSKRDQLNVCLLGPSSTGKTHLAQEVSKYFPEEDVMYLSGATPKSFLYNYTTVDDDGVGCVDFTRKIILFAEMPDSKLLTTIRSILSHDRDISTFLSTAGGSNGGRKTQIIKYEGFPTVIFCSANMRINEQEATRFIMLSPESTDAKIEAATRMSAQMNSDPAQYKKQVESSPGRKKLMARIRAVRDMNIESVIIRDPEDVFARYSSLTGRIMPRDSRDVRYLISLIKAIAMLNAQNRKDNETGNVIASASDIDAGLELWQKIMHTQGSGLVPAVLTFFEDCFLPAYHSKRHLDVDAISVTDLVEYCTEAGIRMPTGVSEITHSFFPIMLMTNLIEKIVDPTDRRRKLYRPLQSLSEPQKATPSEHISPPPYTGPMTKSSGDYDDYGVAIKEEPPIPEPDF